MPTSRMGVLAGFSALVGAFPEQTDATLLERFVQHRDEAAFAAIVRRHGRAVLGVCRRMLGNSTDADDAFQTTFLVLAKKAHAVTFHNDVSAWLFAVAMRSSRELLRQRTRRANRETLGDVPEVGITHDFDSEVIHIVLDEVAKLSESYRAAVVLCELDGISRADAAKRLGIPEGTLSSRLAAARKQLAVRLTARGVTLAALAPLGGFVPSALAASVVAAITSGTPSVEVQNLMEVLMRTSGTLTVAKVASVFAVLTMAVVGWTFGDEPKKPQPIQQATAKVVVEAKAKSQLILTFREEVRYLTPEGKEIQRIDYTTANKAEPDIVSGQFVLGLGFARIINYLPTCGRPGPSGVIPLDSHGLRLLFPGNPLQIKLIDKKAADGRVVGWSADGKQFYLGQSWGDGWGSLEECKVFTVNIATGDRVQLPFGKDQEVLDVTADGSRFLTRRYQPRPSGRPGFSNEQSSVCLMTRDGTVMWESKPETKHSPNCYQLSHDGRRTVAILQRQSDLNTTGTELIVSEYRKGDSGIEVGSTIFPKGPLAPDAICHRVGWSPDGKQIVSVWTSPKATRTKKIWNIVVCDADGKNAKTISQIELKADEVLSSVDWR